MTKKELIKKIALDSKTSVTKTEEIYHIFENALIEAITSNEEVVLSPQIGKFILKSQKARLGRNPQTGKKTKNPCKNCGNFQTVKKPQR